MIRAWFSRVFASPPQPSDFTDLHRLAVEQHAAMVSQTAVIDMQDKTIAKLRSALDLRDAEIADLKAHLPARNSKGVFIKGKVT